MPLPSNAVIEFIRQLAAPECGDTDTELLKRFVKHHDEAAFRFLVARHGAMVYGVCQRVLERKEDAEDAFQATFVALAQQAGSLRRHASIGPWLHEVASRNSRELRRKHGRRQTREQRVAPRPAHDPLADITGRELLGIFHEELAGLAENYRAPLILCCLEGQTGDAAAKQLGWSASTVKRRLAKARELLQHRLARRGIGLTAANLAALLLPEVGSASVPALLATTTLRAASIIATGKPLVAGVVSEQVIALAAGVAHAMVMGKLKSALVTLLIGGLLAGASFRNIGKPAGAGEFR